MKHTPEYHKKIKKAERTANGALLFSGIASILLLFLVYDPSFSTFKKENTAVSYSAIEIDEDAIENGIHIRTGFVDAEGLMTVVNNCTNCHSAKLVIQNRMNRARWEATIQWMQETQNLWDLGGNKEIIVNYLVSNYPPIDKGRRENLTNIEWYEVTN